MASGLFQRRITIWIVVWPPLNCASRPSAIFKWSSKRGQCIGGKRLQIGIGAVLRLVLEFLHVLRVILRPMANVRLVQVRTGEIAEVIHLSLLAR